MMGAVSPAAARDGRRCSSSSTSRAARDGASSGAGNDRRNLEPETRRRCELEPTPLVAEVLPRLCDWCRSPLEATEVRWCSKRCRQAGWRARRLFVIEGGDGGSKRLAYADPPYPGCAFRYYRNEEVDHAELVARLVGYDGWALSTSAKALGDVLAMCPPGVRVGAWVKPNGVSSKTRGPHNTWEAVVYKSARLLRPGFRDWLSAKPARGGGTLPGRKPLKFCAWLFQLLGASPGDGLDDIYPGTGIVTAAFEEFGRSAPSSTPAADEVRCA